MDLTPRRLGPAAVVGVLTTLATLAVMLFPWRFREQAAGGWLEISPVTVAEAAGSILLFLPLGIVEAWLAGMVLRSRPALFTLVAVDGALLAVLGETLQMWIDGRHSRLADVTACALGAVLGALILELLGPASRNLPPPE